MSSSRQGQSRSVVSHARGGTGTSTSTFAGDRGSLMIQYPEHCEEPAMEPHRPDSPAVPDTAIIPAQNLPGAAPVSPEPDSPEPPPARVAVARPVHASRSLAALLLGLTSFLVVFLIGGFATPMLVARWRSIESRAEAEAAYAKRRAELRAEADAADER